MRPFLHAVAGIALLGSHLRADLIYVSTGSAEFGTYDTQSNIFTHLGDSAFGAYGLAISRGALYANDSSANSTLYQVNASTGAFTSVGALNNPDGAGTIFSAPGGGAIYFADSQNLYTVDASTGQSALIGALGFTIGGPSWDTNYGPDGNGYTSSNGSLYSVNLSTGAGALIGSFGGGLQIGSIIGADGLLYGFTASGMYDINISTGAATLVQNLSGGHGTFFSETQVPGQAPEPAAFGFAAIGMAGIAYFRSRRAVRASR